MKISSAVSVVVVLASGASAFNVFSTKKRILDPTKIKLDFTLENIPGAVAPLGIFDPAGFASKADQDTLKRYREAEIVHGRVAMLASVGFLVGEKVEGSSFLFDGSIQGPAITHLVQVPAPFWATLAILIGRFELDRAQFAFVPPTDIDYDKPGLLRKEYTPGDLNFDPFRLKPKNAAELVKLQDKELQNGRLAMIAAAGFMAQELVDGKGIIEHWLSL